ncbi:MAG TPA: 5-formyltetrahydrofolate cyclo-ligase [Polyangiaceae bacterium]|nr:5-formyltetrahydrofolate cyclo-ligase [Polyangiaceae bacterium]
MIEDSELRRELASQARRQLRTRMRALRAAHPEAALELRSARIRAYLEALPEFKSAQGVALFWPLTSEVDLRPLDVTARSLGKRVYYPFLEPGPERSLTGFARVDDISTLAPRGQRFFEPQAGSPHASRGEIDLVVVPALAVSTTGHRLGYGSGFYDATLPDFIPPAQAVVVAYDFQLLAELPTLHHDVACHVVVTDARTLRVPSSA